MDTNLLHEFVTLAEYLNFSTAAKMMNMSQSTLSRHIGDLERHYGTLLFSRRDSLTLTYAGQILLEECAACSPSKTESKSASGHRSASTKEPSMWKTISFPMKYAASS